MGWAGHFAARRRPAAGRGSRAQLRPELPADLHPGQPLRATNVAGYQTFRQVADAGSFEGQTTVGLGVRARLPFRAFILAGPGDGSRLVVDVAHRW